MLVRRGAGKRFAGGVARAWSDAHVTRSNSALDHRPAPGCSSGRPSRDRFGPTIFAPMSNLAQDGTCYERALPARVYVFIREETARIQSRRLSHAWLTSCQKALSLTG